MSKTYSIAIDGPAGAGKSTIAKRLAKELGYMYVDTGAIYRTVAYFFDLWGVAPKDIDGISRYIDELTVGIEYDENGLQHMIMNGMDVTDDIRTQDISQKASLISAHAIVREMLLDKGQFINEPFMANASSFAEPISDSDKLVVSAARAEIVAASWKMVYAKTDAEFEQLWSDAKAKCEEAGIKAVYEWRVAELQQGIIERDKYLK